MYGGGGGGEIEDGEEDKEEGRKEEEEREEVVVLVLFLLVWLYPRFPGGSEVIAPRDMGVAYKDGANSAKH